jgi:hypothetical protein
MEDKKIVKIEEYVITKSRKHDFFVIVNGIEAF